MTNTIARATLNIGHNIPSRFIAKEGQKVALDSEAILSVLKALGIQVIESACHPSESEDTTVAAIAVPLSPKQGHQLSELLFQDAIVQFVHGSVEASALFGPKADEWGPFNPELFVTLAGGRLATEPVAIEVKLGGQGGPFTNYIIKIVSGPSAGHRLSLEAPSTRKGWFTPSELNFVKERLTEKTGAQPSAFIFFKFIK